LSPQKTGTPRDHAGTEGNRQPALPVVPVVDEQTAKQDHHSSVGYRDAPLINVRVHHDFWQAVVLLSISIRNFLRNIPHWVETHLFPPKVTTHACLSARSTSHRPT